MRVLFVHQNFPGQFGRLASAAVARGDRVVALHYRKNLSLPGIEAIRCVAPESGPPSVHRWASGFENQVRTGEATAIQASRLKAGGFEPDLIVGHPGWGEMLFLKEVWPQSRVLCYPEYFYQPGHSDAGFDSEFNAPAAETPFRLRIKNSVNLHAFAIADRLWCPTEWQRSKMPADVQSRTSVVHDGIDTTVAISNPNAIIAIKRDGMGRSFKTGDEVITFVNRNHEPVRGFPVFMRSLAEILVRRPEAHALLVGGDEISYGTPPPREGTWKNMMLKELGGRLDISRVHFLGRVPKDTFLAIMQVSALHVYLTYPFVLSWSLLEAMSCGGQILASRTGPVTEFIEDGVNGMLFDFFRPDELATKAVKILRDRAQFEPLRCAARETILRRCDLHRVCLPRQLRMMDELVTGT